MTAPLKKALIVVQARSTNTRLPGKCWEPLGRKTVLERVLETVWRAQNYVNRHSLRNRVVVETVLAVPEGDPLAAAFKPRVNVFEGSEADVLGRFVGAHAEHKSDFVVRITADCPLVPDYVIAKHIVVGVERDVDYISHCHPEFRTAPDGFDCEMLSARMLAHLDAVAVEKSDREHVTTWLRKNPLPPWVRQHFIIGYVDLSFLKISIDTPDDLAFVRRLDAAQREKKALAERTFGRDNVSLL